MLDDLEIERDRGITVKARAVAIHYTLDGQEYELNLIDTPGHVDFHYEVSRSLAACEGALLLVDAFQGVQAQTVANAYLGDQRNLVDHPGRSTRSTCRVDPDRRVLEEIETVVGLDATEALMVSAKQGIGIEDVFDAIIEKVPRPKGNPDDPLRALVFDSKYDTYRGVVIYVRVKEGTLTTGKKMRFMRDRHGARG